jgi:hypothetical protein
VLGFAMAGLLLGHALSYLLAVPDPNHRDLVLRTTGHSYLPTLGEVALLLLLAGVAAVVVRSWSGRRPAGGERYASLAGLLGGVQVTAFVGQELLERLVSRSPLGELVHDHILLIGVAVQILLALAGAAALRWLVRTSDRLVDVVARRAAPPLRSVLVSVPTQPNPVHGRTLPSCPSVRAPPSP